jgi:hypothetical protein
MLRRYQVRYGDTLPSIAQVVYGNRNAWRPLIWANPQKPWSYYNGIKIFTDLRVGEWLNVPPLVLSGRYPNVQGLGQTSTNPLSPEMQALLANEPAAQSAWTEVQNQINSEGGGNPALYNAANTFYTQYQGISATLTSANGIDIAQAAKQFTLVGDTVAGAVTTVNGLIQAAKGGVAAIPQLTQTFTGLIVGIFVSTDVIAPGVGAIIMAGIGAVLSLLEAGGLFASTPGADVCGDTVSPPPAFTINCLSASGCNPGANAATNPCQIQPGSAEWKSFPEPSNPLDAAWFATAPSSGDTFYIADFAWTGTSAPGATTLQFSGYGTRPIDVAFPEYRQFECESIQNYEISGIKLTEIGFFDGAAVVAFLQAFFVAWKLNQEYALNGLVPQPTPTVLLQTIRMWNTAHAPGDGHDFAPSTSSPASSISLCNVTATYVEMLVTAVLSKIGGAVVPEVVNGNLHINTGDQLSAGFLVDPGGTLSNLSSSLTQAGLSNIRSIVGSSQYHAGATNQYHAGATNTSSTKSSTAGNVAVGTAAVVGTGAVAAFIYSQLIGVAFGAVVSKGWAATKNWFDGRNATKKPARRKRSREGFYENPVDLVPYSPMDVDAYVDTNDYPSDPYPSDGYPSTAIVVRKPERIRKAVPDRRVAFRVNLDVDPSYEAIILVSDDSAVLYRYRKPIIKFRPTKYQFGKIRQQHGELLIYADQIVRSLIGH